MARKDEWANEFMYECSRGHFLESMQPVTRCPGRHRDRPCDGTLARYGPGSRTQQKEAVDVDHA